MKMLDKDGWRFDRTRGSHRQFVHSTKPGVVTVPANRMTILVRGAKQHSEAIGIEEMKKHLIVIEETVTGYSAYSPDLDGCVATGKTREKVAHEMQSAIAFQLEGIERSGEPIPEPHTYSAYVEIRVQSR